MLARHNLRQPERMYHTDSCLLDAKPIIERGRSKEGAHELRTPTRRRLATSSSFEPLARSPITALPAIILRNWCSGTRSLPRAPRCPMGLFCKCQAVSSDSWSPGTKHELKVISCGAEHSGNLASDQSGKSPSPCRAMAWGYQSLTFMHECALTPS